MENLVFVDLDAILTRAGNFDLAVNDNPPNDRFAVEIDARMTFEINAHSKEEAVQHLINAFRANALHDPLGYIKFRIGGVETAAAELMTVVIHKEAADDAKVWNV